MFDNNKLKKKPVSVPDYREGNEYCKEGTMRKNGETCVQLVARAVLPTRFGTFVLAGFYDLSNKKEHTALIKGDVRDTEGCPVRIHSECHTGDVFFSLKCDCREQLEASLKYISSKPYGLFIYLRQEGRGIGLLNKIKAYHLQELGLDTVEANEYLGLPDDARNYAAAAAIIDMLEIRSVSLLTNNPDKLRGLQDEGINIVKRIPLIIEPNSHNRAYLKTKREKMGHLF
jgi:GTP cyclohydrolase II